MSPFPGSPNRLLYTGAGDGSTPPPPSCGTLSNGTDVPIRDLSSAGSSVTVSGCGGNASSTTKVEVHIEHTWRGDLVIDLVAPDGSAYRLKNFNPFDGADDVHAVYTVNASNEARNGTWKLRVQDLAQGDTGYIDTWSLTH